MTSGARLTMRASRARVLPPWPARLELSERSNMSAPRLFGSLVSFGLNSAASWPASKLLSKSLTGHLPIDKIGLRGCTDTRSEERRVGKEGVSPVRYRWTQ